MAENYVLLETIELTQTATSVTFDNLPTSGYTDLKIVASIRGTGSNNYIGTSILLNGTSASTNWGRLQIEGGDAAVNAYTSTSSSGGYFPDGNFTANAFGTAVYYFPNYRSSNYKTINVESAGEAASTTAVYIDMFSQTWANTAAITSINMGNASSPLAVGCTFSLYGIAATGTTPAVAPKATGGNIVANDGTYWYHAFLSSGTFTPQTDLTANVLQIAGGGGGTWIGGGGAGGISYVTSQSLTNTNYSVIVGAGGAWGTTSSNAPNGTNSQFASLTAAVGGGGGGYFQIAGSNGGCGGGGADRLSGVGLIGGTGSQGGNGGRGLGDGVSYTAGGGGGGMGGNGSDAAYHVGGNGGAGVNTYSSWATPTNTGVSGYYASGGGGASNNSGDTQGTASSGGGSSAAAGTASNAVAGTGGGGGGTGAVGGGHGGNGGSGIVIIRYAMA